MERYYGCHDKKQEVTKITGNQFFLLTRILDYRGYLRPVLLKFFYFPLLLENDKEYQIEGKSINSMLKKYAYGKLKISFLFQNQFEEKDF